MFEYTLIAFIFLLIISWNEKHTHIKYFNEHAL
jgi:hypothetical protein